MSTQLVSITSQAENLILKCARVSSPNPDSTNTGLIDYLIEHKHWSPFMMAHAVFEINTSRAISQQIIRHWSISCLSSEEMPGIQEFSQRYSEVVEFETYKARRQADKNRQSSVDDLDDETVAWFNNAQGYISRVCRETYKSAIQKGIAKEQARFLLPSTSATKMYLSGSIRSWIHYLNLRCAPDTQLEHREIALSIRDQLSPYLPTVSKALGW